MCDLPTTLSLLLMQPREHCMFMVNCSFGFEVVVAAGMLLCRWSLTRAASLCLSQHNRARKCQVYTLTPATPTPPDTTQGRGSALASLLTGKEAYCCPQHTDKPHTTPQWPSRASADNPSSHVHPSASTHEQVTSYTSQLLQEETTPMRAGVC